MISNNLIFVLSYLPKYVYVCCRQCSCVAELLRVSECVSVYPIIPDRHSINEVAGVDRIVEALHAHTWSNMVTKGNTGGKFSSCV